MRPLAPALVALLTLAAPAAHASDVDLFTLTGNDVAGHPYRISFSLAPEGWSPSLGFDFVGVDVDINGAHRSLNFDFNSTSDTPPGYFEFLPNYPNIWQSFDIEPNIGVFPIDNLYGPPYPPVFTLGTYAAENTTGCSAPAPASSLAGLPVIETACNSPVTLTVTVPGSATAATPEPTPFVLLGTGLLGAAGALRRRLRSSAGGAPRTPSLTYPAP